MFDCVCALKKADFVASKYMGAGTCASVLAVRLEQVTVGLS